MKKYLSISALALTGVLLWSCTSKQEKMENKLKAFIEKHEATIQPLSKEAAIAYWNASISGKDEDYAKMERDFCVSFQKEYNEDDVIFVSEDDLIAVKDVIFAIGEPQYCESNITFDLDLFLKETYSFENTVPKDEYISTSFVYRLAA